MEDAIKNLPTQGLYIESDFENENQFTIKQNIYNFKGLDASQKPIMHFVETRSLFRGTITECKAFIDLMNNGHIRA